MATTGSTTLNAILNLHGLPHGVADTISFTEGLFNNSISLAIIGVGIVEQQFGKLSSEAFLAKYAPLFEGVETIGGAIAAFQSIGLALAGDTNAAFEAWAIGAGSLATGSVVAGWHRYLCLVFRPVPRRRFHFGGYRCGLGDIYSLGQRPGGRIPDFRGALSRGSRSRFASSRLLCPADRGAVRPWRGRSDRARPVRFGRRADRAGRLERLFRSLRQRFPSTPAGSGLRPGSSPSTGTATARSTTSRKSSATPRPTASPH